MSNDHVTRHVLALVAVSVAASVASIVHVVFFVFESVLWTRAAGRKAFRMTASKAATTEFMAFNQGFYNLFLALGCGVGVPLLASGNHEAKMLIAFVCASMLGAACVLATGGVKYLRAATLKGLPPLLALVGLFFR